MGDMQVTSVSSKGQIVIPVEIRKSMGITIGTKFIIITDNGNLLLKPIQAPKYEEFKSLFKKSSRLAKKIGLKQADVKQIIKHLRNENRS